jgi:diacylglycerol kinase family enzyme
MRTCVIYNPAAGRGKAEKLLKELAPTPGVELRPTARPEHAIELAQRAATTRSNPSSAATAPFTRSPTASSAARTAT